MITVNFLSLISGIFFKEINVLKDVNKVCFGQNNKKMGKFSFLNI